MKVFLLVLGFSVSSWAAENESVSLSRYFTIKTCYDGQGCVGPAAMQMESANSEIELKPFKKGNVQGVDGWDRQTLTESNIPFKSEIHLIKHSKPGKYKYYLYTMLRSGKRNGKIKTINLKELSDLKEITLTDEPVKVMGGTVQAQLVVGPKLNIEEKKSE